MCELLGMSTDAPTDICFSFAGLMQRGGATGPHADGWGIVFYEGKGVRSFHDPEPSANSQIAKLVREYPIRAKMVIGHIRQANSGRVCLENTHPFVRELWGHNWVFAHNGLLEGIKEYPLGRYTPIGTTDSEHAFCWLMHKIDSSFNGPPKNPAHLYKKLKEWCDELNTMGVFNMLFSNSNCTFAYCSTKLCWHTRRPPFSTATLNDVDVSVDFKLKDTQVTAGTIIATEPLTDDEEWTQMKAEEFLVFKEGEIVLKLE